MRQGPERQSRRPEMHRVRDACSFAIHHRRLQGTGDGRFNRGRSAVVSDRFCSAGDTVVHAPVRVQGDAEDLGALHPGADGAHPGGAASGTSARRRILVA